MYGTVNALCAKLLQNYGPGELVFLIVWTKEDVLAVLDDDSVTEAQAAELLSMAESLDGHHEYGFGEDTLRVMLDNLRENERQAQEISVPHAALEKVLCVAADFMRLTDAGHGEGSAERLYPAEHAAIRRVSEAIKKTT